MFAPAKTDLSILSTNDRMKELESYIGSWLTRFGVDAEDTGWGTQLLLVATVCLISYLTTTCFRRIVIPAIHKVTARTKATWDDYLFSQDMLNGFCRMIPPMVWYLLLPFAFSGLPLVQTILQKVCLVVLVVNTLRLIRTFLHSLYELAGEHEQLRARPLKGIYQMVNLLAIIVGCIVIISLLMDKDATSIFAGLGASAAVLMLVFKDSILGLVAGIQLSANDMLRPGDWITMTKYGADGTVIEVSLTTVKVQNFDKTITTIPPYALVSDSYQNWRGMWQSGGRRIKRSLFIDMMSIGFCNRHDKEEWCAKGWLTEEEANGEVVNLQVFRDYVTRYLHNRPDIKQDLTILVRQGQPTAEGLPLEIYCFTNTTDWLAYESVQNRVFEHLIAVLPQFGLRLFQRPSSYVLSQK